MTSEGMDRHGLRPRDDGAGSRSVCELGLDNIFQSLGLAMTALVQGPCAVSGWIRAARHDKVLLT
ncbi:MAG: hypothetical protein WA062_16765 [Rhodoferax sp.]